MIWFDLSCLQKLVRVVFKTCSELSLQSGQSWPKKWSDFTLGPNSPGKVVRVVLKSGPSCLKSGPSCPVSIISSVQCQYYWYTLHILQFSYPSNLFSYYQVEGRSKKCFEKVFLIFVYYWTLPQLTNQSTVVSHFNPVHCTIYPLSSLDI